MHARRSLRLILILLGLTLAACSGGSGSSGFDAFPSENAAIQQALDSQQCVEREGLMICAADAGFTPPAESPTPTPTGTTIPPTATRTFAPVPTTTPTGIASTPPTIAATPTAAATTPKPPPTGTATQTPAPRVGTHVAGATSITCTQVVPDGACSFTLPFAAEGFAPTAVFYVAVRQDGHRNWMIGTALVPSGPADAPDFDAPVSIPTTLDTGPPNLSIQLAILVYVEPPPSVPNEVVELVDSGADFAFVTSEILLQPQPAS